MQIGELAELSGLSALASSFTKRPVSSRRSSERQTAIVSLIAEIEAKLRQFPDNEDLQRITRDIYEHGGIVSSVCHGYCGLLNTKLSNGALLVAGRRLTGLFLD